MSDLIPGLGLIWTLIGKIPSLTGERRKTYFDKVLEPCFSAFNDVHDSYNKMNLECREALLELKLSEVDLYFDSGQDTQEFDPQMLSKIKASFLQKRLAGEYIRDRLRCDARQIFRAIPWIEERRLVGSIAYYFLGEGGVSPSDRSLDLDIQGVMERGGTSQWDTPSMELYVKMRDEENLDQILRILDGHRNMLNGKYMDVRSRFNDVRNQNLLAR